MVEIAKTLMSEIVKEKSQLSFDEVNKKLSPKELLQSGESNGISGDSKEINEIDKEINNRKEISDKSNYSTEVNEKIRNVDELNVYQDAQLEECKVNDRTVLKDTNIDYELKDDMGRTNLERMENGRAPIDENGDSYNLHHVGQNSDSPLAELKNETHKTNDAILHDKMKPSEVHGANSEINWDKERSDHWKARAEEIKGEINV